MEPGFSLDVIGPFLKLPNGEVIRDRRVAARRFWRQRAVSPSLAAVIDALPKRKGSDGRIAKGRTSERDLAAELRHLVGDRADVRRGGTATLN
jgi:hypothetical protein